MAKTGTGFVPFEKYLKASGPSAQNIWKDKLSNLENVFTSASSPYSGVSQYSPDLSEALYDNYFSNLTPERLSLFTDPRTGEFDYTGPAGQYEIENNVYESMRSSPQGESWYKTMPPENIPKLSYQDIYDRYQSRDTAQPDTGTLSTILGQLSTNRGTVSDANTKIESAASALSSPNKGLTVGGKERTTGERTLDDVLLSGATGAGDYETRVKEMQSSTVPEDTSAKYDQAMELLRLLGAA